MKRKLLVTNALPYANGPIHIGHLLEHIQSDTWVRFMKMLEHEVYYVCADDAHGTPVMLEAEKKNIKPEQLIDQMKQHHLDDLSGFFVEYDNYYTTHSDENKELAETIFTRLQEANHIATRDVEQLYDPVRKQFLADRYIRGTCPNCKAENQPGDNCDVCSATYPATTLINPRSQISGAKLEIKKSLHYFFELSKCAEFLKSWLSTENPGPGIGPRLQKQAENKLSEWFKEGLQDWDISRDKPYFGFLIPGTEDKYFYVWLDAPIGYLASFKNYCAKHNINFDEYMDPNSDCEMYHFIGKDIMNFHGLFWPAMLNAAKFKTPNRLFIHGFLTVNGNKMSKSKGTFITATSYLEQKLNPDWFRYYIISKLNDRIEDVDLNMEEFVNRVNADLVGKIANIPSRVANILKRKYNNKLCKSDLNWLNLDLERLAQLYEKRLFNEVCKEIMQQAELVNQAIEKVKPWELLKDESRTEELHQICSTTINSFKALLGLLKPIVPQFAKDGEAYLQCGELTWSNFNENLPADHELGKFKHLMTRIETKQLDKLQEANKEVVDEPSYISIKDFAKVELKVAKVISATAVEKSDKLLKLELDVGEEKQRTIFAGIKEQVDPTTLINRKIAIVANLEPRKMRFGISEGMALAAGDDDNLVPVFIDDSIAVGATIT